MLKLRAFDSIKKRWRWVEVPTRRVDVRLTSSELLKLHEQTHVLVPAPGLGKALIPMSITTSIKFLDAAYDIADLEGNPAPGSVSLSWDTENRQDFEGK